MENLGFNAFLDLAIGVSTVFLFVAMMVSAAQELLSTLFSTRARSLETEIGKLLGGEQNSNSASFKNNPIISALTQRGFKLTDYPSYISATHFAQALTGVAAGSPAAAAAAAAAPANVATTQTAIVAAQSAATPADIALAATKAATTTLAQLQAWATANPDVPAAKVVLELLKTAHGDFDTFRASLESWYDSTMDRISGVYKRWALLWSFVIGLAVAALFNIDAIHVIGKLTQNETVRALIVNKAAGVSDLHAATDQLAFTAIDGVVGLPYPQHLTLLTFAGWLITALAAMLGAPFWFDLMKQLINVRGTGPAPAKSESES